ncbi:MAG: C4-dicarboxylic acid transporter DauA [Candidatus Competibacteraceae bacterium]|nr:C4-dicarboxylic acid transporter DauA [Candidatus Competibacteraceae bacterium]MCP5124517.1 C4-dicarboxylic acid transporter DauA [Gammaproteobacteria bacterium]HRX70749.1 C4-dicarboxylic acid transporter DauA [Candidatus Competibacteraceae bacterium]
MKPDRQHALYLPFGTALRDKLRGGYNWSKLQADLLAGVTVGIVAVPLAMALAIGSGVPPQYGLYTAIVAGLLIALTGGSRFSVSGPTAAFIVILHPIAEKYGLGGLVTASGMAGIMLIGMGVGRMGKLIQFIPYPVTTGFTTGIAVVIASLQFRDFFGLHLAAQPEHFLERIWLTGQALPGLHLPDFLIGVVTLTLLLLWPRLKTGLPAPLVGMVVATAIAWLLSRTVNGFEVATIASRFSYVQEGQTLPGIPPFLPQFVLPWQLPGPDGQPLGLSLPLLKELLGPAMAIALLGAIESLLCAVVADGMTGTKHDPDAELIGQGIGNTIAPFFGGIAATGALARTAANIRAGARGPFAAVFHALFILLVLLALAPLLGYLPMAALAALLLLVAWNMSELKHFRHIFQVAPGSDILVLLVCFGLTVIFDMVIAISVGVVLAALLFMNRMAALTGSKLVETDHPHLESPLPDGVQLYEVAGSLFFGAAEKAMSALHDIAGRPRAVIIDISGVTVMDVSGLVALDSAIERLRGDGILVAVAGVHGQPALLMRRAGLHNIPGKLLLSASLPQALTRVRRYLGKIMQ